jgi:hypothetical protein
MLACFAFRQKPDTTPQLFTILWSRILSLSSSFLRNKTREDLKNAKKKNEKLEENDFVFLLSFGDAVAYAGVAGSG